jgi:hypothetical protein
MEVIHKIVNRLESVYDTSGTFQKRLMLLPDTIHDTLLTFRKSYLPDSLLFIANDTDEINFKLEKSLIEREYIPVPMSNGYLFLLRTKSDHNGYEELSCYFLHKKKRIALEVRRFRVENGNLTGIIGVPGLSNTFISVREYDSLKSLPILIE